MVEGAGRGVGVAETVGVASVVLARGRGDVGSAVGEEGALDSAAGVGVAGSGARDAGGEQAVRPRITAARTARARMP